MECFCKNKMKNATRARFVTFRMNSKPLAIQNK